MTQGCTAASSTVQEWERVGQDEKWQMQERKNSPNQQTRNLDLEPQKEKKVHRTSKFIMSWENWKCQHNPNGISHTSSLIMSLKQPTKQTIRCYHLLSWPQLNQFSKTSMVWQSLCSLFPKAFTIRYTVKQKQTTPEEGVTPSSTSLPGWRSHRWKYFVKAAEAQETCVHTHRDRHTEQLAREGVSRVTHTPREGTD